MSEIASVDSLDMILNQMAEKDTSLRHDGEIILNGDILRDFNDLKAEKQALLESVKDRVGGMDTSEIDAKIAEVQERAKAFVVRLHFKAISSDEYLRIVAKHPDAESSVATFSEWRALTSELAEACYIGCTIAGRDMSVAEAPLSKFRAHPAVGFGQLDPIYSDVFNLNTRVPDRSFLS